MITLSGFGKDYGDFTAVESIDIQIEAGETFGFIGPNGAGKSTTIRFLATLLRASRGRGSRLPYSRQTQGTLRRTVFPAGTLKKPPRNCRGLKTFNPLLAP